MTKYRKRSVIIEAYQYIKGINDLNIIAFIKTGDYNNISELPKSYLNAKLNKANINLIQINTLEGIMTVSDMDYVIKGVNGEFYPCKPDIFEKTYELVNNDK